MPCAGSPRVKELYVVTGPLFQGSRLKTLDGRVIVPTHVFKAVYDLKRGGAGVYLAPNDGTLTWRVISTAELQDLTGIDVFPALDHGAKSKAFSLPSIDPRQKCGARR